MCKERKTSELCPVEGLLYTELAPFEPSNFASWLPPKTSFDERECATSLAGGPVTNIHLDVLETTEVSLVLLSGISGLLVGIFSKCLDGHGLREQRVLYWKKSSS